LIKCLLGLLKPDSGTTTALNMDDVGVLFQGGALFDSLTIWENVAFRPLQHRMARDQARALATEKLARVGLGAEVTALMPAELSGGMQKRAALARAIVSDPKMLVFDEPTTGLDPVRAGKINRLIRDIVTETGATALTITHDMNSVHAIADTVAMLHDGRIHWRGATTDLTSSSDAVLRNFLSGDDHED
jgi:phospholipid/cholesterol/gamma-HCH transport system ATP-binding protein